VARYGVIGDMHGNATALRAALAQLEPQVDAILCLGDVVGYNADSNECIQILKERGIDSIAGNHDLISIGRLDFSRCAIRVEHALKRTRRTLTEDSRSWLATLPDHRTYERDILLIHGSADDVQQYMLTRNTINRGAARVRELYPDVRVCFFGHVHEQRVYAIRNASVKELSDKNPQTLDGAVLYLVNPGSIDASRKQQPYHAEFAIYDSADRTLLFQNVTYDHGQSEAAASAGGYRIDRRMRKWQEWRRRIRDGLRRRLLAHSTTADEQLDE
jgi:predicted phosphodiesterase